MRKLRSLLALTTALAILIPASVASVVAFDANDNTLLFGPHQGASSATFKEECKGDEPITGTQVLWHFVLPQATSGVEDIDVLFQTAGDISAPATKKVGGVIHWDVITPTSDVLLDASTDATSDAPAQPSGTNLRIRLSHVCGGGQPEFDATLTTEVHDADHNDVTFASVPLGTFVHDLATVVPDAGNTENVASGEVTFSLFAGLECGEDDGALIDSETANLGDDNTPGEPGFDPDLQATSTPRQLGAGDYSFSVFADITSESGITITVFADCEPFTVDKADTTVVTEVHDAAHNDITGSVVPLGSWVHDKAIIDSGLVDGFDPMGDFKFRFFSTGDCTGSYVQEIVASEADGTAESTPIQINVAGHYSYQAKYKGDDNYNASLWGACEPFDVFNAPLTPGYWKNHLAPISASCKAKDGCSANGPWTITYLPQSLDGYEVNTTAKATAVWNKMNCSNTGSVSAQNNNAIGCLAGHLLAAKLNVANGSDTCINATIAAADAFLASIPYTGPTGNYSGITAAQRATAISLKNALDTYNNGGGCPI
jgi:hypothetical protein